jgi:hypothetical protein
MRMRRCGYRTAVRPGSSSLADLGSFGFGVGGLAGKVEVIWAKTPTGWTESKSVMLRCAAYSQQRCSWLGTRPKGLTHRCRRSRP